ncbi:MAG TPA: AAA family ATPase [Thermoleophilaceae bacterium]|nr:AAA family ATPase [Thermoleophilaceae bacterium]
MPNPGLDGFDAPVRVRHVRWAAPDGGFAVLSVDGPDGDEVTVAGPIAHLSDGDRARVVGRWAEHERYGLQVQAEAAYELDPDDIAGALKYLTTISRIGKRRAQQLVDRLGPTVLEQIDADPDSAFRSLPRMSERAAAAAAESWLERRALRDLYVLLAPHGAGWLAATLHERHGASAVGIVRSDAYRLTEEHGVGFETADAIARAHGIAEDSPGRYRAALVHVLQTAERRDGHTFLPVDELRRAAVELVGPLPDGLLADLGAVQALAVEDGRVALPSTWESEAALADDLRGLARAAAVPHPDWLAGAVEALTNEQRSAVEAAFERRLSVVTGGPGTGKTTLVSTIARLAERADLALALCAPTGRAARRLEEATGQPATTIHRLLEWIPHEGPLRGPSYPIECDLLIVDESSMLSLDVARMLFDAIATDTAVVMVGDADQLPPIGAGKPFADLIESGSVPVARLTHVFRQSAQSMIVSAAHAVRHGELPPVQPAEGQERDFFLIPHDDAGAAADEVVDLASGRLAGFYGVDAVREVQVLSPVYRGALGIDALNTRLRAALNPGGAELLDGDFRAGDKLIQTRNDYETGLMNGQIAIALDSDEEDERLIVEADDGRQVEVPPSAVRWLRPAYAISVHRSQGCEMPVVVIPVHSAYGGMLSRNLLYTAITRARRACVLVGQRDAVARAARRADAFRRHTRLSALLAGGDAE